MIDLGEELNEHVIIFLRTWGGVLVKDDTWWLEEANDIKNLTYLSLWSMYTRAFFFVFVVFLSLGPRWYSIWKDFRHFKRISFAGRGILFYGSVKETPAAASAPPPYITVISRTHHSLSLWFLRAAMSSCQFLLLFRQWKFTGCNGLERWRARFLSKMLSFLFSFLLSSVQLSVCQAMPWWSVALGHTLKY